MVVSVVLLLQWLSVAPGTQQPNQMLLDLYGQYQQQYLQAKNANESRYGDILTGYKNRYADAMTKTVNKSLRNTTNR